MSQAIIEAVGRRRSRPLPRTRRRQGRGGRGALVLKFLSSIILLVETKSASLFHIQPVVRVLTGPSANYSCPHLTAIHPFQRQDMSALLPCGADDFERWVRVGHYLICYALRLP